MEKDILEGIVLPCVETVEAYVELSYEGSEIVTSWGRRVVRHGRRRRGYSVEEAS